VPRRRTRDDIELYRVGTGRADEPRVIPREYEVGGVWRFSDAAREKSRALHPLLAQIRRVELAEGPEPLGRRSALQRDVIALPPDGRLSVRDHSKVHPVAVAYLSHRVE
jgi:hypothetical protein